MKIQYEIDINAPIEKIWNIFDGQEEGFFRHQQNLKAFTPTNGGKHGQEGTVARLLTSEGPYEFETVCTVLEREAPHMIKYMFQNGVTTYTLTCRMEPRTDGFRYVNEAKLVFHGMYRLLMPVFGPMIANRLYDNMRQIKDYLEGDAVAIPQPPAGMTEKFA
jgi:hypothetical protein